MLKRRAPRAGARRVPRPFQCVSFLLGPPRLALSWRLAAFCRLTANTCSRSRMLPFHAVHWVLPRTDFLKFDVAPFIYFSFFYLAFEVISKESLLKIVVMLLFPTFSSRSFIALGPMFTSLIRFFFLIFAYDVRLRQNFIVLHMNI